jgi:hypothetical protein
MVLVGGQFAYGGLTLRPLLSQIGREHLPQPKGSRCVRTWLLVSCLVKETLHRALEPNLFPAKKNAKAESLDLDLDKEPDTVRYGGAQIMCFI